MKRDTKSGAAFSVIAGVILALLVTLLAAAGLDPGTTNGTIETSVIVVVQGLLGGGTVLLFVLSAVSGWMELGGKKGLGSPLAYLACGLGSMLVWAYCYVGAYGS